MASTTPLALLVIITVPMAVFGLLAPPGTARNDNNNILLYGQTLGADEQLAYGNYSFVMQRDCNLVLNDGWQSNTANRGKNCRLSLESDGRLIARTGGGATVWTSRTTSTRGQYAAVLEPQGRVVVYGPAVWSTTPKLIDSPVLDRHKTHHKLNCLGGGSRDNCIVGSAPTARNALFSGETLYDGGRLASGEYQFVMQGDCNLALYNVWESDTHGVGGDCFLGLDHRGGLAIKDDNYKTVWSNGVQSKPGYYVAVVQPEGKVVVYGPAIWSTAGGGGAASDEIVNRKIGGVKLVTGE